MTTTQLIQSTTDRGTWTLIDKTTQAPIAAGAPVVSFRQERGTVTGGTPPHKPESAGRIVVNGGEFYPGVFNCEWRFQPRLA